MKAILNNNPCILTIGGICVVIIGVLTMQYELRRQIEAQRAIIQTLEENHLQRHLTRRENNQDNHRNNERWTNPEGDARLRSVKFKTLADFQAETPPNFRNTSEA